MIAFFLDRIPKKDSLLRGLLFLALGLLVLSAHAFASDLPVAAGSPIAGINFDDRPLLLPVQRNFQMAMLTASSELGRTCGRMEAYGWRLGPKEQSRVNQIFNNTVDRLRAQGYTVESKAATSVSKDVTLFTADREDKHLMFLWSAGEIGLVSVLCESSAPLTDTLVRTGKPAPKSVSGAPINNTLQLPSQSASYPEIAFPTAKRSAPLSLTRKGRPAHPTFSPVGDWVGTYTCLQGTTGGTLQIDRMHGNHFKGFFRFYPTPKNPMVPAGKYAVFGEYDKDAQRILINPGKWIHRPKGFYNTIMIGSFDPVAKTFSGFFQGITGCTSFEARYSPDSEEIIPSKKKTHKVYKKKSHRRSKSAASRATKAKTEKKTDKKTIGKKQTVPVKAMPQASDVPQPLIPDPSSGISVTK